MVLNHVSLREPTDQELRALERLAHSRTTEARLVQRARIITAIARGERPSRVAKELGISRPTVYAWIHRFHEQGIDGLKERRRPGRRPTYTPEQRAEVIAAALTDPKDLGQPYGSWTLDRLQSYLNEQKGIPIKRSRIDEILLAEGLKWRHQETWFGERVDPDFAEKRGSSSGSIRSRPRGRSSSASTRWGRNRPRASRDSRSSGRRRARRPMAGPDRPVGPSRRSTTAGGARAISSGPSDRPPARP